jgi:general secretion pathway protein G
MRRRRGFTIIEILIVIMIIAIIFTAMGINISSLQREANMSRIRADLKTLQLAVESYYKNYMYVFPPVNDYQTILIDATPRILEGNQIDPFGETTSTLYAYNLSPNGSYFVIYSPGAGGSGKASVSDDGIVSVSGRPIWVSNGHQ